MQSVHSFRNTKMICTFCVCAGKRYIFDIKRTSREAYDYARRKLYTMSQSTQSLAISQYHGSEQSMDVDRDNTFDCASADCQVGLTLTPLAR